MNQFIPLSVPNLNGNEMKYVQDAVQKEWVSTGGAYIEEFEKNIAKYLKSENAVACQSGTAALHLSLIQSGIVDNDEVIVPTLTFIAAVNPVRYCNAYPIFMDCDDSLTLDPVKLEHFCENECEYNGKALINKKTKRKIKAIIVVHVFGNLADMEKIMNVANKYNLKVVEDATEALGSYYTEGKYKNKFAGTIGDYGAYSFNGNKIITTGGGGMVIAKNQEDLKKIKHISTQAKSDTLYYFHDEIGYNYRMTNLQAALGVAQLEKLEEFIDVKMKNYNFYKKLFNNIDEVELLEFRQGIRPNHWFYSLLFKDENFDKKKLIDKLLESQIQTRPIWGLIHKQKPYLEYENYRIEKANYYSDKIINIPCSSNLCEDDVVRVVEAVKKYFS